MKRFSRGVLLAAIVTAVAVLAYPSHAAATSAPETRSVELRIELSSESPPDVAAALAPGGAVDLAGTVESVGGTEVDPTTCAASISTPAAGTSTIRLSQCAGSNLAASIDLATSTADVDLGGHSGTGAAKLKWTVGNIGALVMLVVIIVIIIVII